jgi:membrane protein DedA with SNARE-associated domain
LILGFFVPYFQLIDQLAAGASAVDASPFTVEKAVSLLLSGVVCAIAFQTHAGAQPRASA